MNQVTINNYRLQLPPIQRKYAQAWLDNQQERVHRDFNTMFTYLFWKCLVKDKTMKTRKDYQKMTETNAQFYGAPAYVPYLWERAVIEGRGDLVDANELGESEHIIEITDDMCDVFIELCPYSHASVMTDMVGTVSVELFEWQDDN
jgi:hypothetical protein